MVAKWQKHMQNGENICKMAKTYAKWQKHMKAFL